MLYIQSLVDGTLKFRNTSSLTERVRIDSSGNVGIGTQSPQRLSEHLSASTDTQLRVNPASASGNNEAAVDLFVAAIKTAAKNSKAGGLEFLQGGLTSEPCISNGSNVGIGTTSPDTLVNLEGGALRAIGNADGEFIFGH